MKKYAVLLKKLKLQQIIEKSAYLVCNNKIKKLELNLMGKKPVEMYVGISICEKKTKKKYVCIFYIDN